MKIAERTFWGEKGKALDVMDVRKGNGRISWSFYISAIPHKLFLYCLIGGCCRAIWGKLAHIQITQGKLFI